MNIYPAFRRCHMEDCKSKAAVRASECHLYDAGEQGAGASRRERGDPRRQHSIPDNGKGPRDAHHRRPARDRHYSVVTSAALPPSPCRIARPIRYLLHAAGVGRDPLCDLEVHQHTGQDAPAAVGCLQEIAVVLREDEALGPCLCDEGSRVVESLWWQRGRRQQRRGAQHDHAGDVGG